MQASVDIPDSLCAVMPQLARVAFHLTGNRDQAQDLSQEVLLKLWARLQKGQEIDDLRAYAMAALRNQHRQWLRDQYHNRECGLTEKATPPDVFAMLAVHEIERAIAQLPDPQARLMRLVAAGETSPRTLASITGWPLGTVMSRLARARARLRACMGLGTNAPTADLF